MKCITPFLYVKLIVELSTVDSVDTIVAVNKQPGEDFIFPSHSLVKGLPKKKRIIIINKCEVDNVRIYFVQFIISQNMNACNVRREKGIFEYKIRDVQVSFLGLGGYFPLQSSTDGKLITNQEM